MPVELQTTLISAAVAFIIALLTGYLTVQQERRKWLIDLKAVYETERYKTRLASYPQAFEILAQLSHGDSERVTPEKAKQVAYQLNEWFYSTGGMCAEADTRGAILKLRGCCLDWGKTGKKPQDVYPWRNAAMLLLRRDLDLEGLELINMEEIKPLLKKVKAEVAWIQ